MRVWGERVLAGLAIVLGLAWGIHAALVLWFPYQLEYGEGAVLEYSAIIRAGEQLYRPVDQPPYVACTYAPGHLWLAAQLTGSADRSWAGRLICTLSSLVLTLALYAYLRRRVHRGWAFFGTLAFAGGPLVFNWSTYNRIDMLALTLAAFGLFGAAEALRVASHPGKRDLQVGLCLLGAFFTKQSYLAPWAAVVLAYALQERRRSLRLALGTGLGAALGLAWLHYSSSGVALTNLFRYNALEYIPTQMLGYMVAYLPGVAPLLILALLFVPRVQPPDRIWLVFAATALVMALGSGRSGGFFNYFLELQLALSVLATLAAPGLGRAGVGLAGLQLVLALNWTLPPYLFSPRDYLRYETVPALSGRLPTYLARGLDSGRLAEFLRAFPGPVLAENLGNPVVFGVRPWFCDPSTYIALGRIGLFRDEDLVQLVRSHHFSLVILQKLDGNIRFSGPVIEAVRTAYEPVGQAGTDVVYRPRQGSERP